MSFIGFLYKGERPKSEAEQALEKDRAKLLGQVADLETQVAVLQSDQPIERGAPASAGPPPSSAPAFPPAPVFDAVSTGAGPAMSADMAADTIADETTEADDKAKGQFKIAIVLAYAMTAFGGIDLIGIIVLIAIGRDVPDFMQLFFSGILGYFGGALNAYMGVK